MLVQPWFSKPRYNVLRVDIEKLTVILQKYREYLLTQTEKVVSHQQAIQLPSQEDHASLTTLPAFKGPVPSQYREVEQKLVEAPMYKPLFLNDLAPSDRFERRKWLFGMCLPFDTMLYKFAYGNHLGTLLYGWKVPKVVDNTTVSRIFANLNSQQAHYSTRAMRNDFLSSYHHLAKAPKMVLRNIYRTLLQDSSSAASSAEAIVDERVAKAIIDFDDPEIVFDLRNTNGRPHCDLYDPFWEELQAYFDETILAVDERRHTDVLHMPLAISIRHLREIITTRLQQKSPDSTPQVPTCEWLRLQFWPSNQYTNRAIRYTGRFNIKFGVQIRQLRKEHPDSHYVSSLLQYVRKFSVHHREIVSLVSVDDKAIVPVGEPNCFLSTGVHGHNRSLVPHGSGGPMLQALDHDFHMHGIVPSVAFFVDVPDNSADSFYRGQPFVINKDKVTQPSSPIRHAAELTQLVRAHSSTDSGLVSSKPVMIVVSDGGPDHRVTYGSVKVSYLTLFRALDLDMLVCIRTCPYQSWQNIAERVMSTLNLALQNVSLARTAMSDCNERAVKNKNSLSEVRVAIQQTPGLGDALRDSMAKPLSVVGTRFLSMKIKDNPILLGVPATDVELQEQFEQVSLIDPSLTVDSLTAKDLEKATSLQAFMTSHCHASKYAFQVKKCTESTCYYCSQHPIRLHHDVFSKLHFLPLPLLDSTKEHFKKFDEVYGQPLSEKDLPSRIAAPTEEQKQKDKENRSLLIATKVRATIVCGECSKQRCIYSQSKLTSEELSMITAIKDSKIYTCGSALFPPQSIYESSIVVREALVCTSPIEAQYYSAKLVHFEPICYFCGLGEDCLVDNDEIRELKRCYSVVSPICFLCYSEGKKPHYRNPSNIAKKLKIS